MDLEKQWVEPKPSPTAKETRMLGPRVRMEGMPTSPVVTDSMMAHGIVEQVFGTRRRLGCRGDHALMR